LEDDVAIKRAKDSFMCRICYEFLEPLFNVLKKWPFSLQQVFKEREIKNVL